MTFDTPSQNVPEMMPVLDLQVWSRDDEWICKFYEKPMASQYVIHSCLLYTSDAADE